MERITKELVQVFVRCRPLLKSELSVPVCVEVHPGINKIFVRETGGSVKTFSFDKVFGPETKQADIYAAIIAPVIPEVIAGFNCSILAYGQTGTGKTFTIEGSRSLKFDLNSDDPLSGIIPRAMRHLFNILSDQKTGFEICVSFLELYNEDIFDLLSKPEEELKLRMFDSDSDKGSVIVKGLTERSVKSMKEVYSILDEGCRKRRTGITLLNKSSSRSHAIFTVTVKVTSNSSTAEKRKIGKLNLVDLAGSENITKSGATDKTAKEAGRINQSLLALGRVITSLSKKAAHIPYRESKLTRLLRDSLGGQTMTTVIATISASAASVEETINTLEYAFRAKSVSNKPVGNSEVTTSSIAKEYLLEISRLKKNVYDLASKNGFFVLEDLKRSWETKLASLREEKFNMLSEIEALEKENKSLDSSILKAENILIERKEILTEERSRQCRLREELEKQKNLSKFEEELLREAQVLRESLHEELHKDIEKIQYSELGVKQVKFRYTLSREEKLNLTTKIQKLNQTRSQYIERLNKTIKSLSSKVKNFQDNVNTSAGECTDYAIMLKSGFESASVICKSEIAKFCGDFKVFKTMNEECTEKLESLLQELKSAKLESVDKFQETYAAINEKSIFSSLNESLDEYESKLVDVSNTLNNWENDLTSKENFRQKLLKQHVESQKSNLDSISESNRTLFGELRRNLEEYTSVVTECVNSQAENKKLWNNHFLLLEKDVSSLNIFCTEYVQNEVDKATQAHSFLRNYTDTDKVIRNKLSVFCETSCKSPHELQNQFNEEGIGGFLDAADNNMKNLKETIYTSCAILENVSSEVAKRSSGSQDLEKYGDALKILDIEIGHKVTEMIQESLNALNTKVEKFESDATENISKMDSCLPLYNIPSEKLSRSDDFLQSQLSLVIECLENKLQQLLTEQLLENPKTTSYSNSEDLEKASTPPNEETTFSQSLFPYSGENRSESDCPICISKSNEKTFKAGDVGSFECSTKPLLIADYLTCDSAIGDVSEVPSSTYLPK